MKDRDERLKEVACIAAPLEKQTGCPAQLLIAQWAIESHWGEKPTGHFNFFGIKRAARHTKFCTVTTHEVFTAAQLGAWNHQHPDRTPRVIETLPDGRVRVELEDEFADYDSLRASCEDYAWLITHGQPYRTAWQSYLVDKDVSRLVTAVARTYATAPQYAQLACEIAVEPRVTEALSGVSPQLEVNV